MLLILTVISNLLLVTANPFHKYPYVFLLDVGNEELKNTKTDQIRLSVPGGSIALRYPADDSGETISHVRVSGIDFGTDLKANIIDGGPGSKYAVIMFNGNSGVNYDAVITIQTVPDDTANVKNTELNINSLNQDDEANNNSAEQGLDQSQRKELTEQNDTSEDSEEIQDQDELNDTENKQAQYEELSIDNTKQSISYQSDDDEDSNIDINEQNQMENPKAEAYSVNKAYISYDQPIEPRGYVDKKLYDKFQALQPHFNDEVKVYPQETSQEENADDLSVEDPVELDQMFNDEEVHNDGQKYVKLNRNYDTDDNNAVDY